MSRTVTDLVAGSGIEFADRGAHALKGVPGEWQLYAVELESRLSQKRRGDRQIRLTASSQEAPSGRAGVRALKGP